jgi:hypothetical protein
VLTVRWELDFCMLFKWALNESQNVNSAKNMNAPVDKMQSFLLAKRTMRLVEMTFLKGHATKECRVIYCRCFSETTQIKLT